MGFLKKLFHSRDRPQNNTKTSGGDFARAFYFGRSDSGKIVNERSSLQVTAVLACVKVLSESIASLPLHIYTADNDGKKKALEHPLYDLLHSAPNQEMTAYSFLEVMILHLLLFGNSYSQIIRNGKGEILEIYPLLPDKMEVIRNEKTGSLEYIYSAEKSRVLLTSKNCLHIPALGFDGLIGYSPLALARNAIGLALSAEEYGGTLFKNGANPSGVLEVAGKLSAETIERLRTEWGSKYSGVNSGKVAVLEEGLKFTPISLNPADAQFIETRKYQLEEIARIYRVPLHMIGDLDHATFSNIEHLSLDFVKFSLTPWLARIEQSFRQKLLTPDERKNYSIEFNLDGLLRGDYKSRMEGYSIGVNNGFMCPNDIRRLENMDLIPEDEGGNLFLVNGSLSKLKDAGAAYASLQKGETNA